MTGASGKSKPLNGKTKPTAIVIGVILTNALTFWLGTIQNTGEDVQEHLKVQHVDAERVSERFASVETKTALNEREIQTLKDNLRRFEEKLDKALGLK